MNEALETIHNASTAPKGKVLLALSGGVDSAACALLLKQQGFTVFGLVICFSPAHTGTVEAARRAAAELDIPLAVAHCEALFDDAVVSAFCSDYACGRTPNPCVVCNPLVKFHVLAQQAQEMGIQYLATGHYARIVCQNGTYHVAQAGSLSRDQSYMLYRLPQDILSRLVLPLAALQKDEIRQIAAQAGLSSASAPDSQEICFIPDGDYPAFIQARGVTGLQGSFIGPSGENLGPHKGAIHYTPGQRRGLGLAFGKPVFVQKILPCGDIQLNYGDGLFSPAVSLEKLVLPGGSPLQPGQSYQVKIRSMAKPVDCQVETSASGQLWLRFAQPQRAPAPGQHAVLYQNGVVMGGGVISAVQDTTR